MRLAIYPTLVLALVLIWSLGWLPERFSIQPQSSNNRLAPQFPDQPVEKPAAQPVPMSLEVQVDLPAQLKPAHLAKRDARERKNRQLIASGHASDYPLESTHLNSTFLNSSRSNSPPDSTKTPPNIHPVGRERHRQTTSGQSNIGHPSGMERTSPDATSKKVVMAPPASKKMSSHSAIPFLRILLRSITLAR